MKALAVGAGLVGLLGGLVAGAPAAKLIPHLVPAESGVKLYEISGQLFDGTVGMVDTGQLALTDVQWDFLPSRLITGTLAADLRGKAGGAQIDARARRSLFGTISLRDVRANMSVADLKPLLKIPFLPVDGQISALLDVVELEGKLPSRIEGVVRAGAVTWSLTKPPAPLGEFEALIETTKEGIIANIADKEAAVELTGTAILEPEGGYRVELKLRPRPDAPPPVRNNIRAMGRADSQGWQTVSHKGQLPAR